MGLKEVAKTAEGANSPRSAERQPLFAFQNNYSTKIVPTGAQKQTGLCRPGSTYLDFSEVKVNIRRDIPRLRDVKVCGV